MQLPRYFIFLLDTLIALLSVVIAYLLRFNFHIPTWELDLMLKAIFVFLIIRWIGFRFFRTYNDLIFYTNINDGMRLAAALVSGTVVLGILNLALNHIIGKYLMPNSVVVIELLTTLVFMLGYRLSAKILYWEFKNGEKPVHNILLYGASQDAILTKNALERDTKIQYKVVAYIDENPQLNRQKLQGAPVISASKIEKIIEQNDIKSLIISTPTIEKAEKQALIAICMQHGIIVRFVPPMRDWVNGQLSARQIREVRIEDLLERNPIHLDTEMIAQQVTGKIVLITGAAGSIGSEIARQIIGFAPKKLILLDQAETPLFELDLEIKNKFRFTNYEVVIADVRNKERAERVFDAYKPDIVYHAAAYKHVPMMEDNPSEAVFTNVGGTKILADLAVQHKIEAFVFVSTDKAVNPSNIMGASKRVAEMYIAALHAAQAEKGAQVRFSITRFGNVLGSNGSVIPLFRRQIAEGGPVTVTDPEMTRYFMTIPEACQLVLEAGAMAKGGEIFVFDMGASVKIVDLARNMIRLSGLTLGEDIEIVFTGLRPGEKLYEELLNNEELTQPTHHNKILIAKVRQNDFTFVAEKVAELLLLFNTQENIAIVRALKTLVPEYKSNNSEFTALD